MSQAVGVAVGRPDRPVTALVGLLSRAAWFIEDEVRAIADLVPVGGTCIDVGAGYGLYTAAMSAAVGSHGTVHAIEPQPTPRRVIDAVVRLCGAEQRVRRHACVLGDQPGTATLSVPLRAGRAIHGRAFVTRDALHAGPNAEFVAERRLPVSVSTLDQIVSTHGVARLDMVKADVEGAELKVLAGGTDTIDRLRPTVQLEIEERHVSKYGTTAAEVAGFLLDRGYAMHAWRGGRRSGGWRPAAAVTPESRNYLFVP